MNLTKEKKKAVKDFLKDENKKELVRTLVEMVIFYGTGNDIPEETILRWSEDYEGTEETVEDREDTCTTAYSIAKHIVEYSGSAAATSFFKRIKRSK